MPTTANVWYARNGTVLTVDGALYLGNFKTAKINIKAEEDNHSGPFDDFDCRTVIRKGMTVTIDGWTPAYSAGSGDSGGSKSYLVNIGKSVAVTMDVVTGETITGNFIVTDVTSTGDEKAGTGTMTLVNDGAWVGVGDGTLSF